LPCTPTRRSPPFAALARPSPVAAPPTADLGCRVARSRLPRRHRLLLQPTHHRPRLRARHRRRRLPRRLSVVCHCRLPRRPALFATATSPRRPPSPHHRRPPPPSTVVVHHRRPRKARYIMYIKPFYFRRFFVFDGS
jgi:hypothetical protein